jgi:hypothetical protein
MLGGPLSTRGRKDRPRDCLAQRVHGSAWSPGHRPHDVDSRPTFQSPGGANPSNEGGATAVEGRRVLGSAGLAYAFLTGLWVMRLTQRLLDGTAR